MSSAAAFHIDFRRTNNWSFHGDSGRRPEMSFANERVYLHGSAWFLRVGLSFMFERSALLVLDSVPSNLQGRFSTILSRPEESAISRRTSHFATESPQNGVTINNFPLPLASAWDNIDNGHRSIFVEHRGLKIESSRHSCRKKLYKTSETKKQIKEILNYEMELSTVSSWNYFNFTRWVDKYPAVLVGR